MFKCIAGLLISFFPTAANSCVQYTVILHCKLKVSVRFCYDRQAGIPEDAVSLPKRNGIFDLKATRCHNVKIRTLIQVLVLEFWRLIFAVICV